MEKFQEFRDIAHQKIKIADHMLTMTYPLVRDPKLLIAVLENIFLGMTNAMNSILYYDLAFKRIPLFQENFTSRFTLFKDNSAKRYNMNDQYSLLLRKLRAILLAHRSSPVEFSRNDRFVICSEDYRIQTISSDDIKLYLNKAKIFIQEAATIVSRKEEIFR